MRAIKFITMGLLILASFTLNATSEKGVAKVMKKRGSAYITQTKKKLKKGDWIPEGATIKTKSRSFVKLLFIDKSKLTLGANSEMEVTQFPKKEAGIINLVKGQLRSQVTKNYLQIDKKKSKLFIKTKTAAMGVRGTDFQVNYNPVNKNTTLITFEGAVAMGSLTKFRKSKKFRHNRLEKVVSSASAVMVRQGQLSGVMPAIDSKPMAPVKINKKQLKALEANDGSKLSAKEDLKSQTKTKKMARSIIPPGVDSSAFLASNKTEVAKEMKKVDKKVVAGKVVKKAVQTKITNQLKGSLNEGGFVDTKNVFYIPPPKNAAIDVVTNEAIIPPQMGSFDKVTGEYKNDYYNVDENGNFEEKQEMIEIGRLPASSPESPLTNEGPKNIYDMMDDQMKTTMTETDMDRSIASKDFYQDTSTDKMMDDRKEMLDKTVQDSGATVRKARAKIILIRN